MSMVQENRANKLIQASGQSDINLFEVFFHLLRYWKWYVLSVAVCSALMYWYSARQSYTYESVVTVMIRDAAQKTSIDFDLRRASRINVDRELLQFQSRIVIGRAIKAVDAQIDYKIKERFRIVELYKSAPIQIAFTDTLDLDQRFDVAYKDAAHVKVTNSDTKEERVVPIGQEVGYGKGRMIISAGEGYNRSWPASTVMVTRHSIKSLAAAYQGSIAISQPQSRASVLRLSLSGDNKAKITNFLVALVDSYNEESSSLRRQIAANTSRFISERIKSLGQELDSISFSIDSFQRANRYIMPSSVVSDYASMSKSNQSASDNIETQKRLTNYFLAELSNVAKSREYLPEGIGINYNGVEQQISLYNSIKPEYDRWLKTAGGQTDHPMVVKYADALRSIRENISRGLHSYLATLDRRLSELNRSNSEGLAKVSDMPTEERKWQDIERQQRMKERLYTDLLTRREENNFNQTIQVDDSYVMDNDTGPTGPVSPNTTRSMLLGALFGVVLPTIFFILRMLTDNKVHSRKDVVSAVTIPYLGDIPLAGDKSNFYSITEQGTDAVTESFRILRTNLSFLADDSLGRAQRIICASFGEAAGKTFITNNLALSLAFTGRKVAIVDLDIRKGALSKRLGFGGHDGVTNYLVHEQVQLKDIIYNHPEVPSVKIVPAGHSAPNPAELLLRPRLDQLVEELSPNFDYVLIDGVPYGVVADATITNRIADSTIFVLRAEALDRRSLPELQNLYDTKLLKNMAIILNGVVKNSSGYGYGYGYGYGNKPKKKGIKGFFMSLVNFFKF